MLLVSQGYERGRTDRTSAQTVSLSTNPRQTRKVGRVQPALGCDVPRTVPGCSHADIDSGTISGTESGTRAGRRPPLVPLDAGQAAVVLERAPGAGERPRVGACDAARRRPADQQRSALSTTRISDLCFLALLMERSRTRLRTVRSTRGPLGNLALVRPRLSRGAATGRHHHHWRGLCRGPSCVPVVLNGACYASCCVKKTRKMRRRDVVEHA